MTERQPTLQALFDADPWVGEAAARQEDHLARLAREQMPPLVRHAWAVTAVAGFVPLGWHLVRWAHATLAAQMQGRSSQQPAIRSLWRLLGPPRLEPVGLVCLLLGFLGLALLIRGRSRLQRSSLAISGVTTGLAAVLIGLAVHWVDLSSGSMGLRLLTPVGAGVAAGVGVVALLLGLDRFRRRLDELTEQNLEIRLELVELRERLTADDS